MKRLLNHFKTPLARKSSLFYFGSLGLSFGRYFFHLLLLRFLNPESYGEFLSYISLLYLLTIPSGVIQTVVASYVSRFYAENDYKKINSFFYYLVGKIIVPAVLLALLVFVLARPLSILLKANQAAFIVLGVMAVLSLLGAIIRTYLTALQRFTTSVLIGISDLILLLITAIIFLKNGFGALGGVLALLVSTTASLLLTLYLLRDLIFPRQKDHQTIRIKRLAVYSFLFSAGTLSLLSTDILLVRYYLNSFDSGLYSALNVTGRMIYFGLTPLASLVLPIATQRHALNLSSFRVYLKLAAAAIFLGGGAVGLFVLFPSKVVSLLSGAQYLTIVPLIPYIAISMLIFSLNYLTMSYFIAIQKYSSTFIFAFFTALQPLLIILYHQSLYQLVTLNLTLQFCLFLSLLIYYKVSSKYV